MSNYEQRCKPLRQQSTGQDDLQKLTDLTEPHFSLYTENTLKELPLFFLFTRKRRLQNSLQDRIAVFEAKLEPRHRTMKPGTSIKYCHSSLGRLQALSSTEAL